MSVAHPHASLHASCRDCYCVTLPRVNGKDLNYDLNGFMEVFMHCGGGLPTAQRYHGEALVNKRDMKKSDEMTMS